MGSTCESRCKSVRATAALLALCCLIAPAGNAANWPQYGRDAQRSGVTAEKLAFPLTNVWTYAPGQPPSPAWPPPIREFNRMDFDYAPQPVIAGGRVFFGSSTDDTVRALDLATGKILWRLTTGGPVRFAPAVAAGRVYVASDDGHVYCLDAATGKLAWKFRAALNDEQMLGNGRMISRWPCRSGVLIDANALYVIAGMWPSEGVFIHALDAATGKPLWCNDTSGLYYSRLPHGAYGFSGVAPQGYLLAGKDVLLVPTGRSVPAGFDRSTGRRLFYNPQGEAYGTQYYGGTWCRIVDSTYYNNSCNRGGVIGIQRYALADGKRRGGARGLRLIAGNGLSASWTGSQIVGRPGKRKEWRVPFPDVRAMAIAGDGLLAGGKDRVVALGAVTGKTTWQARVNGAARGLAVADGRLIVATDKGTLHCFTPGERTVAKIIHDPRIIDRISRKLPVLDRIVALCKKRRIASGYALVVGENDAQFAEQLATRTKLHVVCAFPKQATVDAARKLLLDATDLYGSRVAVQHISDPVRLPYPSYVANLITVTDMQGLRAGELYRLLRPYGGVMYFATSTPAEARAFLKDAGIPKAELAEVGDRVIVTRGKLPGAFDWDSKMTLDTRVKWPLEMTWFGGPGTLAKTENSPPLAASGRIFLAGSNRIVALDAYNGATLWTRLVSWDHNTGVVKPVPRDGKMYHFTGLAADDESLYAHMANKLSVEFDARTGAVKKYHGLKYSPHTVSLEKPLTFKIGIDPAHSGTVTVTKTPTALELRLVTQDPKVRHPITTNPYTKALVWTDGDYWDLFFDLRPRDRRFGLYGPGVFHFTVIPESAKPATAHAGGGAKHPAATLKGTKTDGGTECVVTIPWAELEKIAGAKVRDFGFGVLLSSTDGAKKERLLRRGWHADLNAYGVNNGWATLVVNGDAKPVAPPATFAAAASAEPLPAGVLKGHRPRSSRRARRGKNKRLDPLTGAELPMSYRRSHGCGKFIGSLSADIFRSGVIGIYDFDDDSGLRNIGGARVGCGVNAMPALGILFADCTVSHCVCGYNLKTMLAMAPSQRRRNEDWALFPHAGATKAAIRQARLNFGAPGDRRDTARALWLGIPRPRGGTKNPHYRPGRPKTVPFAFQVPITVPPKPKLTRYRFNADRTVVANTERPWIYASGYRGPLSATLIVDPAEKPVERRFVVRLHFAEPDDVKVGGRVFDVKMQGKVVVRGVDVVKEAGGRHRALVREVKGITTGKTLTLELAPQTGAPPIISGVEIIQEREKGDR
jgi:outer membrane protein assembly factor BamB